MVDMAYKKINLLLIFIILVSFVTKLDAKKLNVITTFTIIQDIAQNIAGEAANIQSITKPGAEIHSYEPTPLDIVKAQKADLILYNGLDLERWVDRFFANLKNVPIIIVTKNIMPISIVEGEYQDHPNPHAWMSPKNALIYVDNIKDALIKYDPENTDTYNRNAQEYKNKINNLDAPFRDKISKIPASYRYLVSSEGAFSYLAKDYDFKEIYLWAVNAEQQGTPGQIKKVVDLMKSEKIPVIFSESTISDKPAKEVAKEANARYGGILYVDSLSTEDGPVPTYLDLLKVTINTIIAGFEYDVVK